MKITVNKNKKIISAKGHTDMLNKSTKYGNITIPKKSVYVTAKCSEGDRWDEDWGTELVKLKYKAEEACVRVLQHCDMRDFLRGVATECFAISNIIDGGEYGEFISGITNDIAHYDKMGEYFDKMADEEDKLINGGYLNEEDGKFVQGLIDNWADKKLTVEQFVNNKFDVKE